MPANGTSSCFRGCHTAVRMERDGTAGWGEAVMQVLEKP